MGLEQSLRFWWHKETLVVNARESPPTTAAVHQHPFGSGGEEHIRWTRGSCIQFCPSFQIVRDGRREVGMQTAAVDLMARCCDLAR